MKTSTETKLALVVGGSSGMGKETARRLLAQGHSVQIIGNDKVILDSAKNELEKDAPGRVEGILADLYSEAQVGELIKRIKAETRPYGFLVNAAGFFKPVSFLEHTREDYDMQMDLNRAFFFITQAVASNMKKHGGGNIVNIGSMWAHQAIKATPSSAYSMQKAGLHSLTQHLAMELADSNIRVNAVAPAVVLSTIYKAFIPEDKIKDTLSGFNQFHPIGRIGSVEDIANAVEFLFSEKASWITGEVMNVDGGVMAGRN